MSTIETGQVVKIPRNLISNSNLSKLHSELIAEGVLEQITIRSGFEIREKCYVLLLCSKIICIPCNKIEKFKHLSRSNCDHFLKDTNPDIKWFANLANCSFKSVPSYFLKAAQYSSTKRNRTAQSLKISGSTNKEIFVITETCVTNIEPYIVQEERYLMADLKSPKDHFYWANSFQIAQKYTLQLHKTYVTSISDQITSLEMYVENFFFLSSFDYFWNKIEGIR